MAVTLPFHGQTPWSVPLNTVLDLLARQSFLPNDHGYQIWSADPQNCAGGANPGTGQVRMIKMPVVPFSYTITNVITFISVAGVGLTANQNFAGVYDAAGNRLGVTADQSAVWNTTGLKTMPLTAPVVIAANAPTWLAYLYNGTSLSLAAVSNTAGQGDLLNANLAAANARITIGPSGQTSLPASIVMAARTNSSQGTWGAAS